MREKFDWKTSKISMDKSNLSPKDLETFFNDLPRKFIQKNQELLRQSPFVRDRKGIFAREDFEKQFNLTGSFRLSDLSELGETQRFFNQRKGRFFTRDSGSTKEYLLRGSRYISAIDPNISVRQKLQILSEDALDGIDFLKTQSLPKEGQFKTFAPVLDYIKNSAVSILSAYIHNEKIGKYKLDDDSYNLEKSKLIELVRKSAFAYYLSLLDSLDQERLDDLLHEDIGNTIHEASKKLTKDFENHEFPNDALARPETSHPLVILGGVEIILSTHPKIETVVGMPSGATEISCVLAEAYKELLHTPCDLILLPISNHSSKRFGQKEANGSTSLAEFIQKEKNRLDDKNVIIIDDNSSTGATIERARDAIVHSTKPASVVSAVLEADIIRSEIDKDNPTRKNIAHPLLYDLSVSVFPVSKNIRTKHDLKEIMEISQLIKFYREKIQETQEGSKKIKFEVFLDDLENPTERMLEEKKPEQIIGKFQGTYLSNFYAVPVTRDGVTYPSVEHAYQSAKFSPSVFASLTEEQKSILSEILKQKGYAQLIDDYSTIFTEPTIPSGITKDVANKLREWGFVRADWDEVRIEVMIDLLIQKFSIPELRDKLLETKDLYLMEGNTWEDTLWGVCNNKGKNMLGRTLMNLREKIKSQSKI